MIFKKFVDIIISFFSLVTPSVQGDVSDVRTVIQAIQLAFAYGYEIFNLLFPRWAINVAVIVISLHALLFVYYIVMWIIKKIPMLNIH